jgi:hypothetical protein
MRFFDGSINWVQATPVCACCLFLSQVPGVDTVSHKV